MGTFSRKFFTKTERKNGMSETDIGLVIFIAVLLILAIDNALSD